MTPRTVNISAAKPPIEYENEEQIKIHIVIPWLEELGYKKEYMDFEKNIEVHEGRKKKSIFADIVVYSNKGKQTPLIVVDTKSPKLVLSKNDRNQVISYARLLPKIAPLAVLTNGTTTQVFQTLDKTRIKRLLKRSELVKDIVGALISENIKKALRQEAKKELFIIDDVTTFKNLLKRCHNEIRNNEGYDPIQAFDELSKVLFAKMYEEQYNRDGNRFVVEIFDRSLKDLNVNIVQQQFSEIQNVDNYSDLFPKGTVIDLKDRTIRTIVSIFERYDLSLTKFDVKGEAFEYFLSDTFTGGLGEYFTPRNVVEFMVEAIAPKIGDKIIDPFCGTGGFLIYAFDIVSEKIRLQDFSDAEKAKWRLQLSDASLFGTDWKPRTSQACKMNMIVHGDGNAGIRQHDGFIDVPELIEEDKFDILLTNPPFGATETDGEILKMFELGAGRDSQKREILAIERCIRLVKPETGMVAIVLPDGLLNNDSTDYVRRYINQETELLAVVGLNKETFEGYNATAKTSIVIMRRREKPEENANNIKVFMAVCTSTGYAPTGLPAPGNQLPDILFDLKSYWEDPSDFEPIFKHTELVTIEKCDQRIDAERYISTWVKDELDSYADVSAVLYQELAAMTKLSNSVSKALKKIYEDQEFEHVEISNLLSKVTKTISVDNNTEYTTLGVRGKAAGVFKKPPQYGRDIGSGKMNKAKAGWLVFSRLFAKNGSFAIIDKESAGGVFTNEFPTFEIKEHEFGEVKVGEYLVFYLASPQVKNYIWRLTTGSTKESRGRFKPEQLLAMQIPLPKEKKVFGEIVKSISLITKLKDEILELADRIQDLPMSFQNSFPYIKE